MFSIGYCKGFSLWRTMSIEESATIICNSMTYLAKSTNYLSYYEKDPKCLSTNEKTICDKDYVNVIKTIKKDNVTPQNIGEIMLCQIPGISSVTALAIMDHFKCMVNLIADIQEHGEKCLYEVEIKNSKKPEATPRKLNKTCIMNIMKYLIN